MNEGKDNLKPESIAPFRSTDLLGIRVMCTEDWHTHNQSDGLSCHGKMRNKWQKK